MLKTRIYVTNEGSIPLASVLISPNSAVRATKAKREAELLPARYRHPSSSMVAYAVGEEGGRGIDVRTSIG